MHAESTLLCTLNLLDDVAEARVSRTFASSISLIDSSSSSSVYIYMRKRRVIHHGIGIG